MINCKIMVISTFLVFISSCKTPSSNSIPVSGLTARPINVSCNPIESLGLLEQLRLEQVFPNLSFEFPVGIFQAPENNNDMYVIEQEGKLIQFTDDNDTIDTKVFLDISDRVIGPEIYGELGLLGAAFHPNFPTDDRVFVYYTRIPENGETCPRSTLASFQLIFTPPLEAPTPTQELPKHDTFSPIPPRRLKRMI